MQYGELYHRNYCKEVHVKKRVYYKYYHLDGTHEVPADYKEISFVRLGLDGSLELPITLGIVCRSVAKKLEGFEDFHFTSCVTNGVFRLKFPGFQFNNHISVPVADTSRFPSDEQEHYATALPADADDFFHLGEQFFGIAEQKLRIFFHQSRLFVLPGEERASVGSKEQSVLVAL